MSSIDDTPVNYKKKYYKDNKEKLTEYKDCDTCGARYNECTKTNHFNSAKHKRGLESVNKDVKIKELEFELKKLRNDKEDKLNKLLEIIDKKDEELNEFKKKMNIIMRLIE